MFKYKINFINLSKFTLPISIFLCIISILIISKNNINLGLEFTGGIEIELESNDIVNIDIIKKKLQKIKDIKLKYYGTKKNIKIKTKHSNDINIKDEIQTILNSELGNNIKIKYIDYIGSEISNSTIKNTLKAIIIAIISMIIYLSYRFHYKYAISATITLVHDLLLIIGLLSILQIEFNITTLAALFAIFGYSINDTVVVFDRIRENIKLYKKKNIKQIINISINNTLSRTLITSISTLFITIILMSITGQNLYGFSFVLFSGIIIGTYSSICIAAIITIYLFKIE